MFKQKLFGILLLSYNVSTNALIQLTQALRSLRFTVRKLM